MEIEVHQLDLRYRELRIHRASRLKQLTADLSEAGQQSPVLVTAGEPQRYVLIDGYQRVAALRRLGHDTVRATCLALSEVEALLLCRQRRSGSPSALEDGWLLRELRDSHGLRAAELALRLSRSMSWVSRRLALVECLPAAVQRLIRDGRICPYAATKYLVPLARANASACETLARNVASQKVSVRQMHTLYVGWRQGDAETKARLLEAPVLYLAARSAAPPARDDHPDAAVLSDLHAVEAILCRLARRLRERGETTSLAPAIGEAWSAAQRAFDALFAYLRV